MSIKYLSGTNNADEKFKEFEEELQNQGIPTINPEELELLKRLSHKLYKQQQEPDKYKYFCDLSKEQIETLELQLAYLLSLDVKSLIIVSAMELYDVFMQQMTKRFEAAVGISFFAGVLLGIFLRSH